MGWWQARAPIEGAVKLGSTEPTIKLSQHTTKLAVETNKDNKVSHDANTLHDGRPDVQVDKPTNKAQANKAVPEPVEKSDVKSNEFNPNAITSVVPASFRQHEDAKAMPDDGQPVQHKQPLPQVNSK